jgi:hypothetical protein
MSHRTADADRSQPMFFDGVRKVAFGTSRIWAGAADGAVRPPGPAIPAAVGVGDGAAVPARSPSGPVQADTAAASTSATSSDMREVMASGSLGIERNAPARVLDGEPAGEDGRSDEHPRDP